MFSSVCCQYDTERHDIDVVIHIGNFELSSWQTHLDNLTCEQSFWNRNCWGLIISHYSGEYLWTGHRNRCFWSILRHQKPFEVTAGGKRPTRPRVLGIFRVDSSGPWGMVTFVPAFNLCRAASILALNLGRCNPFGRTGECSRGSTEVWWIELNKTCWELHCWWFG